MTVRTVRLGRRTAVTAVLLAIIALTGCAGSDQSTRATPTSASSTVSSSTPPTTSPTTSVATTPPTPPPPISCAAATPTTTVGGRKAQTIAFTAPGVQHKWPDNSAPLIACASSGLPVKFSLSATSGNCQLVANMVKATVVLAQCQVLADQPGNSEFAPATQVAQPYVVDFQPVRVEYTGVKPATPSAASGSATVVIAVTSGAPIHLNGVTLSVSPASVCTSSSDPTSADGGSPLSVSIPVQLHGRGQCTVFIQPFGSEVQTVVQSVSTVTFTVGP